jgi:hypothetical protein
MPDTSFAIIPVTAADMLVARIDLVRDAFRAVK